MLLVHRLYLLLFILFSGALSAIELQGEAVQGALLRGQVAATDRVFLDGEEVMVTNSGAFAIGFGRDASLKSELMVIMASGQQHTTQINLKKRQYDVQRVDGLPEEKVSPKSKEALARIKADGIQIKQARKTGSQQQFFMGHFIWPAAGQITGVYGSQRVLNGKARRPHFGLDIAGPVGSPVVAPASGVVTVAEKDMFFSGGTLLIDHGGGISSSFLHLDDLLVKTGDKIEQGELVARMGATGRVTGSHLDWRINWFDVRLDPALLMTGKPPSTLNVASKRTTTNLSTLSTNLNDTLENKAHD